jgi:hypothetical protein
MFLKRIEGSMERLMSRRWRVFFVEFLEGMVFFVVD